MKKYLKRLFSSLVIGLLASLFSLPVLAAPADMSYFVGSPSDTSIQLTWEKATLATMTVIRYKTTAYPTSATGADGSTLVCIVTGTTYEHIGLTAGSNYYYSAWGYDGALYSTTAKNLLVTTKAAVETGTTIPTPTMNMNPSAPSSTSWYENLRPFSYFVNLFATSWGMPSDTMQYVFGIFTMLVIGLLIYWKTKSPLIAIGADLVVNGALIFMSMLPPFSIGITLAFALGIWAIESYSI